MEQPYYQHIPSISELTIPKTGKGDTRLLTSALTLYDAAIHGRSYDTERNPYGMPTGRQQELAEDYLEGNELIVATTRKRMDQVIGIVAFHAMDSVDHATLWIDGLAVDELHRDRSIGRHLIENVEHHTHSKNISRIALRSTPRAVAFYKRLGFQQTDDNTQPLLTKHI